ncbi:hypothetical protein CHH83_22215 [Bacillus sp. 7586-K]|nr:hypothetical protein CHH83_22215 [Bacillus sp. 7586-K]
MFIDLLLSFIALYNIRKAFKIVIIFILKHRVSLINELDFVVWRILLMFKLPFNERLFIMKNYRYLIQDKFDANSIANDLRVQLNVNRFDNVTIKAVNQRNEVIVQVPDSSDHLEIAVESFMENYQTGVILE